MLEISHAKRIEAAIRAACRRRIAVLVVEQLALAVGLVLAGAVLLLLVGTQLLAWWWLALLGGVGIAMAFRRLRGHAISDYRVAQLVDRRCGLSDSLSTAWFLLSQKETRNDPVARFQIERAAQLAAQLETHRAFPLRGGRNWAVTGALAGVVFGLFAVRYLVTSSLDLHQALIPLHFGAIIGQTEQARAAGNRQLPDLHALQRQENHSASSGAQKTPGDAASRQNEVGKSDDGEGQSAGSAAQDQKALANALARSDSDQTNGAAQASANGEQGSSGLLDKMKDALSSLMAKTRPNASSDKAQQPGQLGADQENTPQPGSAANQGQQSENADSRDSQAKQDQSAQTRAQGQTTERTQSAQGRDPGQSPNQGSDAHSGIGRQDGDKQLKQAEMLRAMGRLEEIIGKRSANLTGDMMVETPSGKQQLKTAYTGRVGQHTDSGGEIDRDEIPLADRAYVREYMELVHKQAQRQP